MKLYLCFLLLLGCGEFSFSQAAGTLDMALTNAKFYVESQLPRGFKVLIGDWSAPSKEQGTYLAEGLSSRLVNSKKLTVVERSPEVIHALTAESLYQLSGEVSDDSMQAIGYKTGAEVVITGSIQGSGDQYRLSLKLTALQGDTVLEALLARSRPTQVKPAWIYQPLSARALYEDKTPRGFPLVLRRRDFP
jgi:TolB-like protein